MPDITTVAFGVATAMAVLASGAFLVSMWVRRTEPLALSLLGVAGVSLLSVLVDFTLVEDVLHETGSTFWIFFVYVASFTALGLWVYFTFQYTGRGRRLTTLVGATIVVVVGLTLVTALAADVIWPERGDEVISVVTGISTLVIQTLTIVSVFMLLSETVETSSHLFREALAHTAGIVTLGLAPFVANLYKEPIAFPVMIAVSSGCFLVAIHRYSLFETLPVARIAGRDRVVNEIADPVVVVDRSGTIQDLNPAAEGCFGIERGATLGRRLETVVPGPTEPAVIAETGEPVPLETADGRTFTVTVDKVTDSRDRLFGYLMVYRDITERRERERRLGVLNQLLVGAVRDRMERVAATSSKLERSDRNSQADEVGEKIWTTATELTELVTRTREVERAMTAGSSGTADLGEVLRAAVDGVADVSLALPEEPCQVSASGSLLETTMAILATDVFRGTAVEVVVAIEEEALVVRFTPKGDGESADSDGHRPIDEFAVELAGLAVEHAGGSLTVLDSDPHGRGAVVRLPACEARANTDADTADARSRELEGQQ